MKTWRILSFMSFFDEGIRGGANDMMYFDGVAIHTIRDIQRSLGGRVITDEIYNDISGMNLSQVIDYLNSIGVNYHRYPNSEERMSSSYNNLDILFIPVEGYKELRDLRDSLLAVNKLSSWNTPNIRVRSKLLLEALDEAEFDLLNAYANSMQDKDIREIPSYTLVYDDSGELAASGTSYPGDIIQMLSTPYEYECEACGVKMHAGYGAFSPIDVEVYYRVGNDGEVYHRCPECRIDGMAHIGDR